MSRLTFSLLGTPHIELDGLAPSFERRKAIALLVYLAQTGEPHSRDSLATLLWPGFDQTYARGNLRRALSALDKRLREEWLEIDREKVSLRRAEGLWVDVEEFQHLLTGCRQHGHDLDDICPRCLEPLSTAVELYRDDFLTGFTLADAPEFDQWQTFQTESLRRALSDALARLVRCHIAQREWGTAITHARRRVALDPLDEAAQRQLIQVYAWCGERTAALRQYQALTELLQQELNATPSPETVELFQQIRAHRLLLPPATTEQPPTALEPRASQIVPESEGEMRVVTALCAGLSTEGKDSADPENLAAGLNQLLVEMEDILAHYEARVERLLGDSVLAVFGAMQTHEDDPERALQAALALNAAVREQGYALGVGVATGEVYFGPVGAGERAVVSAMGPVVNVAARLQAYAGSGQILADRATFRRTRGAFRYKSDAVEISSAARGLTGYVLERSRRRATKTRGIEGLRSELVGRDEELAKLQSVLHAAIQGQGQMVSIIGEAGVGKSRLVAELRSQSPISHLQSPLWLEGRCLEMTSATAYGPFIDLLRSYFAGVAEDTATAIRATLWDLRDNSLLAQEQVEEIGPLLGNLLSVHFGDNWDERLHHSDPQQIRHRTLTALQTLVAAAARSRPLVLVLEDLHWADALSLDLIGGLMELVADYPLLLLCVYRPGHEYPSKRIELLALQRCQEHYIDLRLRALTSGQSQQMIESLLAIEDLSPEVKQLILEKAQGNPFFIEEVVRSLMDAGIVYRDEERWRARGGIESFKVSEGVQSVILDRLDRLDPQHKRLLQTAAVMGRLFRQRVLAQLAPPILDLGDALSELEERDFIYRERSLPEAEYSFKHVLTQEAVYSTLPRQRRTRLHRQVAETIERLYADTLPEHYDELAHHYDRGEVTDKAIEYLQLAGEKARRAYLNDEGIRYFQRVLELLNHKDAYGRSTSERLHQEQRVVALKELGRLFLGIGQIAEAEVYLQQAVALGQHIGLSVGQLAYLKSWLGQILFWQRKRKELLAFTEAALAELDAHSKSMEAAILYSLLAQSYFELHDLKGLHVATDRLLLFIRDLPYSEELRIGYEFIAARFTSDNDADKALEWLYALRQQAQQYNDLRGEARSLFLMARVRYLQGDCQTAIKEVESGLELDKRIGDTKHVTWSLRYLLMCALEMGDLSSALRWAQHMHHTAEAVEHKFDTADAIYYLGITYLCRNDLAEAERCFRSAAAGYPTEEHIFRAQSLGGLARICLLKSQSQQAGEYLKEALALLKQKIDPAFLDQRPPLAKTVGGLEEVYGCTELLHTQYQRFYAVLKGGDVGLSLSQWCLQPATRDPKFIKQNDKDNEILQNKQIGHNWGWHDPIGDCTYQVGDGLEIQAANGRDLFYLNLSAPRLLQEAAGDFAVETVVTAARDDRPAIGGLLLWKDRQNYLRHDRGVLGKHEILFSGCVANQDVVIGRGRLPGERITLRLERVGSQVNALCSADGEEWFTVGSVDFLVDDPVQVGMHAIGAIDRVVYPGAYPEGTAVRFESFGLWHR